MHESTNQRSQNCHVTDLVYVKHIIFNQAHQGEAPRVELAAGDEEEAGGGQRPLRAEGPRVPDGRRRPGGPGQARGDVGPLRGVQPRAEGHVARRMDHL